MAFNIPLFLLTSLALTAFAANSFLCRWALAGQQIDALSFTLIRLLSGAITLLVLYVIVERKPIQMLLRLNQADASSSGSSFMANFKGLAGAFWLFIYAAGFSYAYLSLETGIGALILFAAVQISMIGLNILAGDRPSKVQWLGIFISFSGFIYLLLPTLTSPSLKGFILMTLAGVAWGIYSLQAKAVTPQNDSALTKTSRNFIWSIPFILGLFVLHLIIYGNGQLHMEMKGFYLAVIAGALTSGVGYAIWYQVLKGLNATMASVSQLLVPVIATIMGISFLNEQVELHFIVATLMILGGVMMVLVKQRQK